MRGRYSKFFLLAPAILVILATTTYPLIAALLTSFRRWRLNFSPTPQAWVGLENYERALSDSGFLNSIIVTASYTAMTVTMSVVIGLAMAMLLQRPSRTNMVIKALLIFPFAVSPALKGYSWRFMLNPNFGIFDRFVDTIFPFLSDVIWLGQPFWALFWMATSEVWGWASLIALMFLGALGSISIDIFEAAKLDGANRLRLFWSVTLPLLRPVILITALLQAIFSLKMFPQVVTMTGGGPGNATQTLNYYVYRMGFRNLDMGYASALAYILVVIMSVLAFLYVRLILSRAKI